MDKGDKKRLKPAKPSGYDYKTKRLKKEREEAGNKSTLKITAMFKPKVIGSDSSKKASGDSFPSGSKDKDSGSAEVEVGAIKKGIHIERDQEKIDSASEERCIKIVKEDLKDEIDTTKEDISTNKDVVNTDPRDMIIENTDESKICEMDNPTSISSLSPTAASTLQPPEPAAEFTSTSMPESMPASSPEIIRESVSVTSVENEVDIDNFFVPLKKKKKQLLVKFFNHHPIQPEKEVPFTAQKMYTTSDGVRRFWVTYNPQHPAVFCSLCLAFGENTNSNTFITGNSDWRHIYTRVAEHEKSENHRKCVDAYILYKNSASVDSLLICGQSSVRKSQVTARRQILHRIIDVIKLIGKQNLSYRGNKEEAAYTLNNTETNHGNFLEIILLLGKYDPVLKLHLDTVIRKSLKSHEKGSKQGGGQVTFLSKTMVNYIIEAILAEMRDKIVSEVGEAGIYSIQLDTTQDINAVEQCSIIVRYVKKVSIQERLIGLVKCTSTKGDDMAKNLISFLEKLGLDPHNCIGNSTDGASNMQGAYNGFSAKLGEYATKQVHIWCYAHVLNLVICDATAVNVNAVSLFNLLNGCAVFIQESHKRMDKWTEIVKHRKLNTFFDTRWWAKHKALSKIFGAFHSPDKSLFVELVSTLQEIQDDKDFIPDARVKAKGFIDGLCKYETILTAQLFLRIFEKTTPFSEYLQTKGIDLLKVYQFYEETVKSLKEYTRDFKSIQEAADDFVKWVNNCLEEKESTVIVEDELPKLRIRRKKKQFDYEGDDEGANLTPIKLFECNTHNIILDTVVQSMHARFEKHGKLCADFACMNPKNFDQPLPSNAMDAVFSMISEFKKDITLQQLKLELQDFRAKHKFLKKDLQAFYQEHAENHQEPCEELDFDDNEECDLNKQPVHDENCILCVYKLLVEYNMCCHSYPGLELAYRLLLSLSVTQVCCERCFSKLKIIKSRLRNRLGQELLESFVFMSTERDILEQVEPEKVIDRISMKSDLLSKLLAF